MQKAAFLITVFAALAASEAVAKTTTHRPIDAMAAQGPKCFWVGNAPSCRERCPAGYIGKSGGPCGPRPGFGCCKTGVKTYCCKK
ncbi:hypothetical protein FPQ18DRAFT_405091 [Pyronema domesticum]|uniref:Uncharacterized protein n=1 Tax=Pyronema omphalodes (strain CBS 100304) TaxID=1076935 RepID=U4LJK6_PYROM|nr:hypothetical protein FPQ18DRAFT_405091 [Pyronema domesticum]CCX12666.1 Protein of unknown function [Pyronema omphalodes CBS 100304]